MKKLFLQRCLSSNQWASTLGRIDCLRMSRNRQPGAREIAFNSTNYESILQKYESESIGIRGKSRGRGETSY